MPPTNELRPRCGKQAVPDGAADQQSRLKRDDVATAGVTNLGQRLSTGPWSGVLGLGGVLGGPIAAVGGQWLKDSDNPNCSVGERIGRALTGGITGGIAGALGGVAGAAAGGVAGSSVAPGPGTVVGAGLGAWGGGYAAGETADAWDDDIVDIGGELGDGIGDQWIEPFDRLGLDGRDDD